jgi:hypothetical protein
MQVHITKTPTQLSKHPHHKTNTYTHPHITKQVKTTTVQDTHQINSYNTIVSKREVLKLYKNY